MDQSTHDVRRTNWLNIIEQCQQRPENMTVKQWLADNGIKEKSSFQEQPPVAIIKNGALSIAISNDISEALLDRIFQVIRHA